MMLFNEVDYEDIRRENTSRYITFFVFLRLACMYIKTTQGCSDVYGDSEKSLVTSRDQKSSA